MIAAAPVQIRALATGRTILVCPALMPVCTMTEATLHGREVAHSGN